MKFRTHISFVLAGAFFLPLGTKAVTVATGDTNPGVGDSFWPSGSWVHPVYIGERSIGSLSINLGSDLTSSDSYIGYLSGSNGTVTVDGSGSTWINSSELYVGSSGTGTLNVSDGGLVQTLDDGIIGDASGSTGTATVDGSGSTWNNDALIVGNSGSGTLNVSDGGEIQTLDGGIIGYDLGSTGIVTVDGSGSTWDNNSSLIVGSSGAGTLNVSNGGLVETKGGDGIIGDVSGSTGTATVDGSGSRWINYSSLIVGSSGDGTLNVSDGAVVSSTSGIIGDAFGSTGTATVDGSGSTWDNDALIVGNSGNGTLNVSDGAVLSIASGIIGDAAGSTGVVTVDGSGSTWNNDALIVGNSGNGTLNVSDGGAVVSSDASIIGDVFGSTGIVTVDGSGSTWNNDDALIVGSSGTGTLNVSNGAVVSSASGIIGDAAGSTGSVILDGSGSIWITDVLRVGDSGTGALNVSGGAEVYAAINISVSSSSEVNLHVSGNGMLKAGFDFTNDGTVNLFAYASLAAGTYNPIEGHGSVRIAGSGSYNAFGGTWTGSQFVVNAVAAGSSLTDPQLLSSKRLSYNGGQLVAAFDQDAGTTNFNVTELTPGEIEGEAVSGAYHFDTGLSGSDVYLSFDVGAGHTLEDISIWYLADGEGEVWTLFDPATMSYAGEWLNFTVGSFSSYAVTVVPEPASYSLLLGLVACGFLFRRRQN